MVVYYYIFIQHLHYCRCFLEIRGV